MELAALFWGGVFSLLFLISWGSVFAARRAVLYRHPDPLEGLESQPEAKAAGMVVEGQFFFRIPPLFLPALKYQLILDLKASPGRTLKLHWPLAAGSNRGKWRWTGLRGLYSGTGADLEIRDFWGFCRAAAHWPAPLQVRIHPAPFSAEYRDPLPSGTGDQASRSPRRERNSELLEVRKYYPGDDFRRINWKVFAHAGELFLRIGEENPPPEAQIGLVFDLGTTGMNLSGDLEDSLLDARIAHLGSAARSLTERGFRVVVLIPGQTRPLLWGEAGTADALSALRSSGEASPLPSPERPLTPLLVFTHCLSVTGKALVRGLEETGVRVLTEQLPWPWTDLPRIPWYLRESREARQYHRDRERLKAAFLSGEVVR